MKKYNKNKWYRLLALMCRLLLSIVFIFSGAAKAIDPLGTTYKIQDYFTAFGSFFEQFNDLAFTFSIGLSALEFAVGLMILLNIKPRIVSCVTFLFMLVMTPLTLYIALKNPIQDCGCFGDALVISNWATFWKNVVILFITTLLVWLLRAKKSRKSSKYEWFGVIIAVLIPILLSTYCYMHLPIIDFRPYKIGTNIIESMEIPEDAAPDVYETTFVYTKDGIEKEFSLADYPAEDSGWMFIEQKTKLVKKGFEPPIHDFSIVNDRGDDITYEILERRGYTFLLIMYDVIKSDTKYIEKIKALAELKGINFYVLTASTDEDIMNYEKKTNVDFEWCKTDPITLKTIIRANPGLVLIKEGTIVEKWNSRDIPEVEKIYKKFLITDKNR